MDENNQYPHYGKPQSNWQPETEPIPGTNASRSNYQQAQPQAGYQAQQYQGANYQGANYQGANYQAAGQHVAGQHAAGYAYGATTSQMPPVNQAQPDSAHAAAASKKKGGALKTFGLAFAGAAVACVLVIGVGNVTGLLGGKSTTIATSNTTLGSTTSTEITADATGTDLAEQVASKCLPSVVSIDVYTQSSTGYYGSSSSSNSLTESSLGSGIVISTDGYILTNYHVIEGASALKVTIEGKQYDADIVGSDSSSDVAVIKARDASNLTAIELGDSDSLVTGEWVMSIGSPFGLEQSVATGVVSATSRSQIYSDSSSSSNSYYYGQSGSSSYTLYVNMIQTDAAINPGNSGGALVDKDGKLIGMNTLITSYSGNYSGVGFAIPVNYAINLAKQIIDGKTPTHAQLGVTLSSVSSNNSQLYGLSSTSGAYVSSVSSGSGAANAGIQQGDIITKFGDKTITSASDLMLAVREKNPGDTVAVELNRNGQTQTVNVTLGDDSSSSSSSSSKQNSSSGSSDGYGSGSGSGSSIYDYFFGGSSGSNGTQSSLNAA